MYKTLGEQYEEAFGIERKRKTRTKCLFRRMSRYKMYSKIFGEKRARKLILLEKSGDS